MCVFIYFFCPLSKPNIVQTKLQQLTNNEKGNKEKFGIFLVSCNFFFFLIEYYQLINDNEIPFIIEVHTRRRHVSVSIGVSFLCRSVHEKEFNGFFYMLLYKNDETVESNRNQTMNECGNV